MTALIEAKIEKSNFWISTFLVSGTCIGGGMLAMPIQVAEAGFFLTLLNLFICWVFMTFTGLLLVEATLWLKNETHFASLSRFLVGNWLKFIALAVYLFMNYASLIAYTASGASLIHFCKDVIKRFYAFTMKITSATTPITTIFYLVNC